MKGKKCDNKVKNKIASPEKTKNSYYMIKQSQSWAYILRKHNLKRYMHPNVHSSTIYNSQDVEASKCPSTDDWIKKMWYIYTMEYYSAIEKNEILLSAVIWMGLEIIILSEVSQTESQVSYDAIHMWNF